jgi:lipopolysaccharide transport system ATP-binding protein
MAISARNIVVEFPIYGTSSRSLKKSVLHAATGGTLAQDATHRIVVRALDDVSFEIRDGDRVGLVGQNGSGKTTLLRVLAGAYEPVSGSIASQGRIASMLSITLGMDPEATGLENIYLRGTIMGLRRRQIDAMVEDTAAFTELGDYLQMPMRTYSSGMAMRLAFAISTSLPADIILMDEWLSVGDQEYAAKAQSRLRKLLDQARILVLASHEIPLIKSICNKVMRLEHGRLVRIEDIETFAAGH